MGQASATYLSRPLTSDEEDRARQLHADAFVADTCGGIRPFGPGASLAEPIAAIRSGGVDCIGLTLVSEAHNLRGAIDWIAWWNEKLRTYSSDLVLVETADEIRQAREDGRISVFYLFQSGKPFEDVLGYVDIFRELGITSSQLTYNLRSYLGDGHYEAGNAGLSALGKKVVERMNEVGMLVDLSHSGEQTQLDSISESSSPVYFSHSNTRAVYNSARNASDDVLKALATNGGMINVMGLSVSGDGAPTVKQMVDHLDHAVGILGEDHVGLSSDCLKARDSVHRNAYLDDQGFLNVPYEGTLKEQRYDWNGPGLIREYPWFEYPDGLETYDEYPNLTKELIVRGYSDEAIKGFLGANFLKVFEQVVG